MDGKLEDDTVRSKKSVNCFPDHPDMHAFKLIPTLLCFFSLIRAQQLPHPGQPFDDDPTLLEVQYFSVGCMKLRVGESAVLTDPFWTHLPMQEILFGDLESDSAQIEPHLPALDDIDAVVISHGHYDHVMDLPYIAPRMPREAIVMGSESTRFLLAPYDLPQPYVDVDEHRSDSQSPGKWTTAGEGRIRILPVRGQHPDHVAFIHLWGNSHPEPLKFAPRKGKDYQEGPTLAWLIDFLAEDGQTIEYRVFFQSSVAPAMYGFAHASVLAEHPVDLAIIGMGFADLELEGKDNVLSGLKAKKIMFCHWENFFRPKTQPPSKRRLRGIKKKIELLKEYGPKGVEYILPEWDGRYYFSGKK
jgi:glyoxylase-like metal-dependent hydrolase (beta-lactamase superfamily II)